MVSPFLIEMCFRSIRARRSPVRRRGRLVDSAVASLWLLLGSRCRELLAEVAAPVVGEGVERDEPLDRREVVAIARVNAGDLCHCDPCRVAREWLDAVARSDLALRLDTEVIA